jgi:hypothetical protein
MNCLHQYARDHLSNVSYGKALSCFECRGPLYLNELRRMFADNQLIAKYQQRLFEQTVDMIWCPRCQQSIVCLPSESKSDNHPSFVECFHCQFMFCRRCQQTWHPQIECPSKYLPSSIDATISSNRLDSVTLKKLLADIESIFTIEKHSKPCPSCGVRIEKNGGCAHMNCRACLIHFCWTCGWFGKAYGAHPCKPLMEKSQVSLPFDIDQRVIPIFDDVDNANIPKQLKQRMQRCPEPSCRHIQMKIGTSNLLTCEKCQVKFCFLCSEIVYGEFHYSPYTCQRNSSAT